MLGLTNRHGSFYQLNPPPDRVVAPGDELIVLRPQKCGAWRWGVQQGAGGCGAGRRVRGNAICRGKHPPRFGNFLRAGRGWPSTAPRRRASPAQPAAAGAPKTTKCGGLRGGLLGKRGLIGTAAQAMDPAAIGVLCSLHGCTALMHVVPLPSTAPSSCPPLLSGAATSSRWAPTSAGRPVCWRSRRGRTAGRWPAAGGRRSWPCSAAATGWGRARGWSLTRPPHRGCTCCRCRWAGG